MERAPHEEQAKIAVCIRGASMTPLWRKGVAASDLAEEALTAALKDAGVSASGLKAVIFSNFLGLTSTEKAGKEVGFAFQSSIRGQAWLSGLGLAPIPIFNLEAACAGGIAGLFLGVQLVRAGLAPLAVVGVEQTRVGEPDMRKRLLEGAVPAQDLSNLRSQFGAEEESYKQVSVFMAMNAHWGSQLLQKGLATELHFAKAALKARNHALLDKRANQQSATTLEEILNSPVVIEPLRLEMCSRFCDGAAAVILDNAKEVPEAPVVRSIAHVSGDGSLEYHDRLGQVVNQALETAQVGIGEMDVLELHDATSIEEIYSLETVGLFPPGEAAEATASGRTSLGGGRPVVNPSGGLVGRGHPLGATGLCQVVEITEQLRGSAGIRQIEAARLGLAVNSGGVIDGDAAVCGAVVLEGRRL